MNEIMQELGYKYNTDYRLKNYVHHNFGTNRTPCSLLMGVKESTWESWVYGATEAPKLAVFLAKKLLSVDDADICEQLIELEKAK